MAETVNSEKLIKKELYEAICTQMSCKVVGKQPERVDNVIKCVNKDMRLFKDGVRGKYLRQIYDLLTFWEFRIESERVLSAARLILNKFGAE